MMTVSNVINATGQVSVKTRALVRQAIRNTGYIPNLGARSLASGGSNRIALIYSGHQAPFLGEVLFSAFNATAGFGAQLILRESSSLTRQALEKLALSVARSGIQRLMLAPPCAELLVESTVLSVIKVVAIATAGALPDMHTVRIDNRTAAATLTEFLIRLGHRRIGFITGSPRHGDSKERRAGYEQAMQQSDIPVEPELIADGEFTFESGRSATEQLLDLRNKPTAIIASNDDMAAGTLWMAQQRGLKLPDDLSVAGFDDTPTALKTWPPLTVIRQPIAAMVERGVALLMGEARDTKLSAPRDVILDYTLVERASTARCR
jgi:LacI family transcriptional regulator